jgi:hypothetical protein
VWSFPPKKRSTVLMWPRAISVKPAAFFTAGSRLPDLFTSEVIESKPAPEANKWRAVPSRFASVAQTAPAGFYGLLPLSVPSPQGQCERLLASRLRRGFLEDQT